MKTLSSWYIDQISGEVVGAPCACNECRAGQAGELDREFGQGHFRCETVDKELLDAEKEGLIFAGYCDNAWKWFVHHR